MQFPLPQGPEERKKSHSETCCVRASSGIQKLRYRSRKRYKMRFESNDISHREIPTILQTRTNGSRLYHCDYKRIIIAEVKGGILLAKILQCCISVQNTPEILYLCSISLSFGNKLHFHQVPRPQESEYRVYPHPRFTPPQLHRI